LWELEISNNGVQGEDSIYSFFASSEALIE